MADVILLLKFYFMDKTEKLSFFVSINEMLICAYYIKRRNEIFYKREMSNGE